MSSPSLSKLMPTSTSNSPLRSPAIISTLSNVSMSECIYLTLICLSVRYAVKLSAIFLVSVTSTRAFLSTVSLIRDIKSSICPSIGCISTSGSISPVGLISCSTTCPAWSSSYFAGVADTHIICPTLWSNSSNLSGRLSYAEGSLKP